MSKVTPKLKADDFHIFIDDDVYRKIFYWIHKSGHEVSGFGNVEFDRDKKTFNVTDAMLIKQENGPTSSEIDPAALGKAMFEVHKKGQPNGLKWWWHSHVNMGVFWSADDMECIRSLGQQGWLLSTVFNKRHESRSAFYQTVNLMGNDHEIFVDDINTEVNFGATDEEKKAWDEEYADKVSIERPSTYYTGRHTGFREMSAIGDLVDNDYHRTWERELSMEGEWDDEYYGFHTKNFKPSESPLGFPTYPQHAHDGWTFAPELGEDLYNPLYDKELSKRELLEEVISVASGEMHRWLYGKNKRYRKYVDKYITFEEDNGTSNETVGSDTTQ